MASSTQKFFNLAALGLASTLILGGCASDPCRTITVSNGNRGLLDNYATQWRGNEIYQTECNYQHATPASNFNLPGHLGLGQTGRPVTGIQNNSIILNPTR